MKPSLEAFSQFSATNHWVAIWPELSLACLALLVLALDLLLPAGRKRPVALTAMGGLVVVLALLIARAAGCESLIPVIDNAEAGLFSGMIGFTRLSGYMEIFFVLTALLVNYVGFVYLKKQNLPRSEFFALTILITAALMLLVNAANFVLLFVVLETVTIGFYVMVSYCRYSPLSLEAGLKYLIMGAVSSSILLFGIVLLYGAAGNPAYTAFTTNGMDFAALADFVTANTELPLVRIGAVMVLCGLLFKIGAVPFQIWIPDVYQGAPTPVTAFLAVGSKAAGIAVLLNLIAGPFAALGSLLVPLLSVIAVLTILFGNLAALGEQNVKRMMGLSGVSHAGYLLLGVIALYHGVQFAAWAIVFYLFAYLFASFLGFGIMAHVASAEDADQRIGHYHGLGHTDPFLAGLLSVALGSLAGIPPLVGFIAKVFLFIAAFQAGLYGLLGVAIVGVVLSIYYYFGWMRALWFTSDASSAADEAVEVGSTGAAVSKTMETGDVATGADSAEGQLVPASFSSSLAFGHRALLIALAVVTVVLGLFQIPFTR